MNWRQVKLIAQREIVTRSRSRGYRAITLIMVLLAIAGPVVMSLIPSPTDDLPDIKVGLTTLAPAGLEDALKDLATDIYDLTVVGLGNDSTEEINEKLSNGRIDVVVEGKSQLAWAESESPGVSGFVSAALNQVAAAGRAADLDLDLGDLVTVFTPLEVEQRFVEVTDNNEEVRQGVALFGLFLAFLLPQVFGQLTMLSVIEEKSTRIVEVLLSQIRPRTLLIGKILGLCALAVLQLLLIVIGLVGSLLTTNIVDVPASVWQFVPLLVVSILGGLAIYTTLFALLGSLISRQEDAAQVMFPVFTPLMIGYFVGQAAVFGNAEAIWVKVLTWFPLTAPMLLPVRVAKGAIGPLELIISLSILTVSVYLLIRLASRIYEFTLLRTGSRVSWGELFRLSRGSIVSPLRSGRRSSDTA